MGITQISFPEKSNYDSWLEEPKIVNVKSIKPIGISKDNYEIKTKNNVKYQNIHLNKEDINAKKLKVGRREYIKYNKFYKYKQDIVIGEKIN